MNKLNCFFVVVFMSFSALAEDAPRMITLVPANQLDINQAVHNAVTADCADQNQLPANATPIGAFQVDVSKLDLTIRQAAVSRDSEFEVNGQRFVPLVGPQEDHEKPKIDLVSGDHGFLALSTSGLKFQVGNVSGKVDGKRIKFTVPIH